MSRGGCLGFAVGSLVGLLLLSLLMWLIRPTLPIMAISPETLAPDMTLFLSERSASRFATQTLQEPTSVNFEPGGQAIVTTRVNVGGLEPVVDMGLSLQRQGPEVVSQLHWLQLGWVRIPARWLPPEITALGAKPGQALTQHLPPQFALVGLTTTSEGINLQLNWLGQ
jgi:hypothetical protein